MYRSLLTAFLLGALVLAPAFVSAQDSKSAFTDAQKKELAKVIETFILDNPETLIASVEAHYNKQAESQAAQTGSLDEVPEDIVDANTPAFGPENAKVTVVEFFDYNCGYCKQVVNDLSRTMEENKDVRFVFKELPILSETSEAAARYALAAHKQGRYLDFHSALMNHRGGISEELLKKTAETLKLDVKKLEKDADSQDIRDALMGNMALARSLGVRGTPFFLFNKEKVPGAIGYTRMKELIAIEKGEPRTGAASASTSGSAAAVPTAVAPAGNSPEFQAELKKAKEETAAMIEELKNEAIRIKEEAEAQLEEAKRLDAAKRAEEEAKKKAE